MEETVESENDDEREKIISIYYSKLNKFGDTLIDDVKIYSGRPGNMRGSPPIKDPDLMIDSDDNVHLVFEVNSSIYYSKLDDNGQTIVSPKPINNIRMKSTDTDIAIDNKDNIHIVWTTNNRNGSTIQHIKLDNNGDTLLPEMSISSQASDHNSYDPSIHFGPGKNVFISWYKEYHGVSPRRRYICIVKMNLDGRMQGSELLEVTEESTGQFSIEMVVDPDEKVDIIWTKDNQLKLLPISSIPSIQTGNEPEEEIEVNIEKEEENKEEEEGENDESTLINYEPISMEFIKEDDNLFSLNFDDYRIEHDYFIELTITKSDLGRVSGELLINKDGSDFEPFGEWDLAFRRYSTDQTKNYDVTHFIESTGEYRIKNEINSGFAEVQIEGIRLYSDPPDRPPFKPDTDEDTDDEWIKDEYKLEKSHTLFTGPVYEPAVSMDLNNDLHIVWYNESDDSSELFYLQCDYSGNNIQKPIQLTHEEGKSYDPAICTDDSGAHHIVWLDERSEEVEVYYMKLDNNGNILIEDRKISGIEAGFFRKNILPISIGLAVVGILVPVSLKVHSIRKK
ncbi:MAG: hypothetical protein QF682_09610 [Candidatus Thermoplasmatota archaeon]|jgi:hypothetical protein|nr:hypothetical protein [Candidatus Thermoplasmatota archaeon]